jgi:hypothetical protein
VKSMAFIPPFLLFLEEEDGSVTRNQKCSENGNGSAVKLGTGIQ